MALFMAWTLNNLANTPEWSLSEKCWWRLMCAIWWKYAVCTLQLVWQDRDGCPWNLSKSSYFDWARNPCSLCRIMTCYGQRFAPYPECQAPYSHDSQELKDFWKQQNRKKFCGARIARACDYDVCSSKVIALQLHTGSAGNDRISAVAGADMDGKDRGRLKLLKMAVVPRNTDTKFTIA